MIGLEAFIRQCLTLIMSEQNLPPPGRVNITYLPNSDHVQVHIIWDTLHQSTVSIEIPGLITSKVPIKLSDHTTKIVEDLKKAIFEQKFTESLEAILDTES